MNDAENSPCAGAQVFLSARYLNEVRTDMNENDIGRIIIGCAIKLHRDLGPGLFESVYEVVLANRIRAQGLRVQRQVAMPLEIDGITFETGFRVDLIVENRVIVEVKSLEALDKVHHKQVLTYLRLSNKKLGYVLNFGRPVMKAGISRILNGTIEAPDEGFGQVHEGGN